jgi:succinate dehydrogenase / fumarate reductase membrane anchor subunit
MESETPLARVRGLGSASEGADHWFEERLLSAAMLLLLVWLAVSLVTLPDLGRATVVEWLESPINAAGMLLTVVTFFWHSKLGLQVIIEDYAHDEGNKVFLIVLVTFLAVAPMAVAAFALVKIVAGGASG